MFTFPYYIFIPETGVIHVVQCELFTHLQSLIVCPTQYKNCSISSVVFTLPVTCKHCEKQELCHSLHWWLGLGTEPYSCHSFSRQSRSSFLASVDITGVMTSALEFQNLCSQFIIRSLLSRRTLILLHRVPPTRPYKFLNSHGVVKINTQ